MYLGMQDIRYWPYWCRSTCLPAYLSLGLTTGAEIFPGIATRKSVGPNSVYLVSWNLTGSEGMSHVRRSILGSLRYCLFAPCTRAAKCPLCTSCRLWNCSSRLFRAKLQHCPRCRHLWWTARLSCVSLVRSLQLDSIRILGCEALLALARSGLDRDRDLKAFGNSQDFNMTFCTRESAFHLLHPPAACTGNYSSQQLTLHFANTLTLHVYGRPVERKSLSCW